jgi:hypothetical protein
MHQENGSGEYLVDDEPTHIAIARALHDTEEKLATFYNRKGTGLKWNDLKTGDKALKIAVVRSLMDRGIIPSLPNRRY